MKTYIIAEIGINHNGSIELAKRLIDAAIFAGANAVKFQKRNPDVCVPEHQKNVERDTPWGKMTYLEYKKKIEFEKSEYDIINEYCKNRIEWSASPWDLDSANFLKQYDLPWIKVASASITNLELLRFCANNYKKVIISTGMSTICEIDAAVNTLKNEGCNDLSILHCNSSYPAQYNELNLKCILTLKSLYPFATVGYSGHEYGLTTSIASICLGAKIIERHITIDRTMWGTDQMASVEPTGFHKLVKAIRELEQSLGDGQIGPSKSELPIRKKLRKE